MCVWVYIDQESSTFLGAAQIVEYYKLQKTLGDLTKEIAK
jgi:hypothetical protein